MLLFNLFLVLLGILVVVFLLTRMGWKRVQQVLKINVNRYLFYSTFLLGLSISTFLLNPGNNGLFLLNEFSTVWFQYCTLGWSISSLALPNLKDNSQPTENALSDIVKPIRPRIALVASCVCLLSLFSFALAGNDLATIDVQNLGEVTHNFWLWLGRIPYGLFTFSASVLFVVERIGVIRKTQTVDDWFLFRHQSYAIFASVGGVYFGTSLVGLIASKFIGGGTDWVNLTKTISLIAIGCAYIISTGDIIFFIGFTYFRRRRLHGILNNMLWLYKHSTTLFASLYDNDPYNNLANKETESVIKAVGDVILELDGIRLIIWRAELVRQATAKGLSLAQMPALVQTSFAEEVKMWTYFLATTSRARIALFLTGEYISNLVQPKPLGSLQNSAQYYGRLAKGVNNKLKLNSSESRKGF